MRIGIVSMFSFRPHVEHMAYLAALLGSAGHEIHGFTCDSVVEHCYSRDFRGGSAIARCSTCIAGGIRSYPIPNVWPMRARDRRALDAMRLERATLTSVATRLRTEAASETREPDFRRLQQELVASVETAYGSARRWIESRQIDAVLVFNGRMDLTNAVISACEDFGRPFMSVERTWFGHGLTLNPNQNCLGTLEIRRLSREFRERPLLPEQAAYAGRVAADRFRQRNVLEWRLYNAGASQVEWPVPGTGERVLILPSSRNEFEGHSDFADAWHEHTDAMAETLVRLGIPTTRCVLRCHPNWSERIGSNTGARSEHHYSEWARSLGIHVVPSADRSSTYSLLERADLVIVNSSSTGVEAGLRGKPVVCIGHASYEDGGFTVHLLGPGDWSRLDALRDHRPDESIRLALRYVYVHGRRYPQFVDYVRAVDTMHYRYLTGADAGRVVRALHAGHLEADDPRAAEEDAAEAAVVARVRAADWDTLAQWSEPDLRGPELRVHRRTAFRWVDGVRRRFARGDL